MRLGILSDLHLGGNGSGRWNNDLRYDLAEELVQDAVRHLNNESLDMVAVLGDLTQHGLPSELDLALRLLDRLQAPWVAVPGNHDLAAVESGKWESFLADHLLPAYVKRDGQSIVSVNRFIGDAPEAPMEWEIGQATIGAIATAAQGDLSPLTLVMSHVPLMSLRSDVDRNGGKYAGDHHDGLELVSRLHAAGGRHLLVLAGHLHMNHIGRSHCATQLLTGGIVEYPGEYRVLEISREQVQFRVGRSRASETLRGVSDLSAWPAGRVNDRFGALDLSDI